MRTYTAPVIYASLLVLGLGMPAIAKPQSAAPARPGPAIESLKSPAGAGSSEPQMTVQGDRLMLSWLELDGERATLKFAERTAAGWSAPKSSPFEREFFRQLIRRPFGARPGGRIARGTLAGNKRPQRRCLEDRTGVVEGRRRHMVQAGEPASRRDADRARVRIPLSSARCRTGSGLDRWAGHKPGHGSGRHEPASRDV